MLNEKPNQNTHCMIPFNQIPENSIYSYRKGKKKKKRCMCQEKKMGGGMNYKER